jgi:outer membrane protein OmpA-like peptidoglycan-associated protein
MGAVRFGLAGRFGFAGRIAAGAAMAFAVMALASTRTASGQTASGQTASGQTAPPPGQAVAGPYVSLGAGAGFNSALVAQPSAGLGMTKTHDWNLDTGPSGQIGFGWGFGNGLRLELQADLAVNKVGGVGNYSVPQRAGGLESKYGGFVNLMYDFNLGLPVVPYIGIGAGGQEIEHDNFNRSRLGFAFADPVHGHQVVGDFAYQGIAGLSYPVDFLPGLSLTAEYRFLGLLDPQPGFRFATYSAGDPVPNAVGNLRFSSDYDQSVMLGLRYVLFPPRSSVVPPDSVPLSTMPPVEQPARTYLVFFDWDRADLTTRARQIVAEAATASSHVQITRIEVNGYTDTSGGADYNKRLSVRRGESVAAELVRDGVARDEIAVTGYGEANPLVPTGRNVREPQNRRVEIILH